jgi:hypothetical protein
LASIPNFLRKQHKRHGFFDGSSYVFVRFSEMFDPLLDRCVIAKVYIATFGLFYCHVAPDFLTNTRERRKVPNVCVQK